LSTAPSSKKICRPPPMLGTVLLVRLHWRNTQQHNTNIISYPGSKNWFYMQMIRIYLSMVKTKKPCKPNHLQLWNNLKFGFSKRSYRKHY